MNLQELRDVVKLKVKKAAKGIVYNTRNHKMIRENGLMFCRFRSESFPKFQPSMWLDKEDAIEQIQARLKRSRINESEAEFLKQFSEQGFYVAKNLIPAELAEEAKESVDGAIQRGEIHGLSWKEEDLRKSRVMDFQDRIPVLAKLFKHPRIIDHMRLIFDRPVVPFQSLNFYYSSQQAAHSDAIHMTTYPYGYMSAAWIALEDINPDSGPLTYIPRSHKLPYVLSKDVGISEDEYVRGGRAIYEKKYEAKIASLIKENGLKEVEFCPKKGDVLFWHHNLLHGGSLIKNPSLTRRSFVCHYFAKDVICYHDLIAEQAKIKEAPIP